MIFLVTKSVVQLPFSRYIDSHDSKTRWVVLGAFLIAMVPFVYIMADNINHVYLAQLLYGIGSGLAYPTWLSLWSTHLDRKHEGFEWSLYSTMTGFGTAATAAIGAVIAQFMGFTYTFLLVGIMSLIGCAILIGLGREKRGGKVLDHHYHRKRKTVHAKHH